MLFIEFPIGTRFMVNKIWFEVIEVDNNIHCCDCCLNVDDFNCNVFHCSRHDREDRKNVILVEVKE